VMDRRDIPYPEDMLAMVRVRHDPCEGDPGQSSMLDPLQGEPHLAESRGLLKGGTGAEAGNQQEREGASARRRRFIGIFHGEGGIGSRG